MGKNTYYITTPIYYPSDNFHIGHCYTTVIADALARYKRLKGYDVFFLTGSDEHGQKIEERAKKKGCTPKEFVDPIIDNAKDLWKSLDISYNKFIRTTDPEHVECVQKVFKQLYDQGDIYKGTYEGWYCTPCESFWTESQLKDGKCPDCGREVKLTKENAYFLKLSKYQKQLEEYLEGHKDLMQPVTRYNEMYNNFLKPGLKDLCVSRSSVKWGIPVTFDPEQTVYVWVDALTNYISALGYKSDDESLFEKYWPADLHLVGKEIFRFHTIIWPIMLIALGLPLPKKVYGHGWLTMGGDKISKSKGNFKDPRLFIEDYGVDTIRYFLLSEVPFGSDGNFSELLMVERRNSDLCNVLGNLVNRTISMANKYFGGKVSKISNITELDNEVINYLNNMDKDVDEKLESLNAPAALADIFSRLNRLNKYIDETEPWKLAKLEDKSRLNDVLYVILDGIRLCAIELEAFIPATSKKIYEQINVNDASFENNTIGYVESYQVTEKPEILFARIDEKELKEKLEAKEIEHLPEISIDDFAKMEMVVGEVLESKKHEKADKLLVSKVDIGGEVRQIVSGIAEHVDPKEFVGKKVVVLANLKPVKIRGVESQGMIICAENEGKIEVVTSSLPAGSKLS
ncbi:MAG: methionine--tRNA ligase [Erysipelotrichaceae bacterium]|nr:methionine--tRNA ligase [Solobacterium sp.]MDY2953147.1 methionine--tRNA ligase [Erysipelotrichaceae bacterium]MCI6696614.1 methionine--tRNA ligase [Solobacterium sp.]MCI6878978.1 methionine--tRNA ligase [Solobacterium sp.]MCI7446277.1 methionine--tRNA ligase [Solobacterium sp.]